MNRAATRFALPARLLHWGMAALILAMLFIGAGMVSTASARYPALLAWHRPIGLAILLLAVLRLAVRATHRPPPLPDDLPTVQAAAARVSHYLFYALMLAMPLIGWAMLSAAGTPAVVWKGFELPPIVPHEVMLFGWLRYIHGLLGYAFFLLILGHVGAALIHALIRRDDVFASMAGFGARRPDHAEPNGGDELADAPDAG